MEEPTGKAKGGLARTSAMTSKERKALGKKGAAARWADLPKAICGSPDRPLRIGDIELQCYVLEGGLRVLSQAEFLEALGRHRKANVRREGSEEPLPAILQGKAINPFITKDIFEKSRPIKFRTTSNAIASGYRADLLPSVCEVYLKARDANVLPPNQQHVAKQADILMRGLAHVGIIALVDEATGYQYERTRNSLAQILEAFVAKELQPWIKTFPDEFYAQLFRLRGLEYDAESVKRPQYFGTLTNDIVWKRIAPGVLTELKRVIPKTASGRRKATLAQALTRNIGYPKLREHLGATVAYMTVSPDYPTFVKTLDTHRPRFHDQLELPFDYRPEEDDGKGL
jgi:hypothetical protein